MASERQTAKGARDRMIDDPEAHTEQTLRALLGPLDGGGFPIECCSGLVTWRNGVEAGLWTCLAFHRNGCDSDPGVSGRPVWFDRAWWTLRKVHAHPYGEVREYDVAPRSHSTEGT